VRKFALALAVAALFALPTSAFSQDVEIGPGGVQINPGYHHHITRRATAGNCAQPACTKTSGENRVKGTVNVIGGCADDPHAPSGVWARKGDCGHVNGKGLCRSATEGKA
jgi:hypothetical protein